MNKFPDEEKQHNFTYEETARKLLEQLDMMSAAHEIFTTGEASIYI